MGYYNCPVCKNTINEVDYANGTCPTCNYDFTKERFWNQLYKNTSRIPEIE